MEWGRRESEFFYQSLNTIMVRIKKKSYKTSICLLQFLKIKNSEIFCIHRCISVYVYRDIFTYIPSEITGCISFFLFTSQEKNACLERDQRGHILGKKICSNKIYMLNQMIQMAISCLNCICHTKCLVDW